MILSLIFFGASINKSKNKDARAFSVCFANGSQR